MVRIDISLKMKAVSPEDLRKMNKYEKSFMSFKVTLLLSSRAP